MFAHGKITNRGYFDIPIKLQSKVNRAEEYALNHYEEHREKLSDIFKAAEFEIYHNYVYDVVDKKINNEEYENLVKLEFIYRYTKKMIWNDIWKIRKNKKDG